MAGSCCRNARRQVYAPTDSTPCKEIEQGGAGLSIWIMNIRGMHRAVMRRASGEFVTVESFLAAYACRGPTASMLRTNLDRISAAANKDPAAFQRFASTGASLVQLLKTADTVLKAGSKPNERLQPHTRR